MQPKYLLLQQWSTFLNTILGLNNVDQKLYTDTLRLKEFKTYFLYIG